MALTWLTKLFKPRLPQSIRVTDEGFEVSCDGKVIQYVRWNNTKDATHEWYTADANSDVLGRIRIMTPNWHLDLYRTDLGWKEFASEYERRCGPTELRVD